MKDIQAASCWGEILVKGYCSNLPKILGIAILLASTEEFMNIDDALLLSKALIGKYSTPNDPKLNELFPNMLEVVGTFGNYNLWRLYFRFKYQNYSSYFENSLQLCHLLREI